MSAARSACITGASRGIGESLARRLAKEGYNLVLLARSHKLLERLSSDIREAHPGILVAYRAVDIRDFEVVRDALDACEREVGEICVLANNAGISDMAAIHRQSPDSIRTMIDVNLTSAALLASYVLSRWCPAVASSGPSPPSSKTLLFLSSVAGLRLQSPALALYVATKQALIGLALATLQDVRRYGVKVSVLCPGLVNTDLGEQFLLDYFDGNCAVGPEQLLQPDDVAQACLYVINASITAIPYLIVLDHQRHARKEFRAASLHALSEVPLPRPLSGRVRPVGLITGASRGIGCVCSVWLARQGYDVVLLARTKEALEETAALCIREGVRAHFAVVDVSDVKALEDTVVAAVEGFGRGQLDVVISNAGMNKRNSSIRGRPVFEQVIQTNLIASSVLTRVALRYMPKILPTTDTCPSTSIAKQRPPAIVYIGSNFAREITIGSPGQGPYISSKMGLLGLANSVFQDVREFGIRVVSILPGLVANDLGSKPAPESLGMSLPASDLISDQDLIDALDFSLIQCSSNCCPTHIYLANKDEAFESVRSIAVRFGDKK